jgi:hypothetical protein
VVTRIPANYVTELHCQASILIPYNPNFEV